MQSSLYFCFLFSLSGCLLHSNLPLFGAVYSVDSWGYFGRGGRRCTLLPEAQVWKVEKSKGKVQFASTTVFTRIGAAVLIWFFAPQVRRLFKHCTRQIYFFYPSYSIIEKLPFLPYLRCSKPVKPGQYSVLPSHILRVLLTKYGKVAQ